jgi:hypothetical protein
VVNRKVINATPTIVDNVKYRSKLEARCAQILKENNILFEYEPFKIEYIPKFEYKGTKYRAAYYTPDFVIDNKYILEIKGFSTEVYKYKKKLVLLTLLRDNNYDYTEIKTLTELRKWIIEYKENGRKEETF